MHAGLGGAVDRMNPFQPTGPDAEADILTIAPPPLSSEHRDHAIFHAEEDAADIHGVNAVF